MPGSQKGGKDPGLGREVAKCTLPMGRKALRQVEQDWSSCWHPEGLKRCCLGGNQPLQTPVGPVKPVQGHTDFVFSENILYT